MGLTWTYPHLLSDLSLDNQPRSHLRWTRLKHDVSKVESARLGWTAFAGLVIYRIGRYDESQIDRVPEASF
jgi:hypothetical protein